MANALTLATTMSMPPKSAADLATHALRLSALPTSATEPITLLPDADMALAASATSAAFRAQNATLAPSLANVSAIARPMPLVPPVTSARKPLSCMSMFVSLDGVENFQWVLDTPVYSLTVSRSLKCSRGISPVICPRLITKTRSDTEAMKSKFCSTNTMVSERC